MNNENDSYRNCSYGAKNGTYHKLKNLYNNWTFLMIEDSEGMYQSEM